MYDPKEELFDSTIYERDGYGNVLSSHYTPSDPEDPKADLFNNVVTMHDQYGRYVDTGFRRSDGTIIWNKKR